MLLVTTPIEETWGKDEKVLFLGEWCLLYHRKEIWDKRRYLVLPYHWDDRKKLESDFLYLQVLNEQVIKSLTIRLNSIHSVNHSSQYWGTMLGNWVSNFTAVIYDRWYMIEQAVSYGQPLKTYVIEYDQVILSCTNTSDFINSASSDDSWNHALFSKLIELNGTILRRPINVELKATDSSGFNFAFFIKYKLIQLINLVMSPITVRNKVFIVRSYFPLIEELKLNFKFGQLPIIPLKLKLKSKHFQYVDRKWKLNLENNNGFEKVLSSLVPLCLPKVFLEQYNALVCDVSSLRFPRKPKFIITALEHFHNEHFLEYMSRSREKGTKFLTIDHGGLRSNKFNGSVNFQNTVSDVSLTWGWNNGDESKMLPYGIVKTYNKRLIWNNRGPAILIQVAMPRYSFDIRAMPIGNQMISYFKDQHAFYAGLSESIRLSFKIRLYQQDYLWSQKKRWQDIFPNIRFSNRKFGLYKEFSGCRLIVCSYNATTYLESLSMNLPTIVFWDLNLWELPEKAVESFKELESVGIFHTSPTSASQKVMEVWDNVGLWWNRKDTQQVRNDFCMKYAKEITDPFTDLKNILDGL